MSYKIGDVVKSIAGHDAGRLYIVIAVENNFCFVADGRGRLIDKPKKKKVKHLAYIASIEASLVRQLTERCDVFCQKSGTGNAKLRRLISVLGYPDSSKIKN